LAYEFPCWRLVIEKIASLEELETHWSLDDVARANAILDMQADTREANENVS